MFTCDPRMRSKLLTTAEKTFTEVSAVSRKIWPDRDDAGLIFYFYTKPVGVPAPDLSAYTLQMAARVGQSAGLERDTKTQINGLEKVTRLALHENRFHVSSWQTRDFRANLFGGGIRFLIPEDKQIGLIAASGFNEPGDEMFDLRCIDRMGWQSWRSNVQRVSENPLFDHFPKWSMEEAPPLRSFEE